MGIVFTKTVEQQKIYNEDVQQFDEALDKLKTKFSKSPSWNKLNGSTKEVTP